MNEDNTPPPRLWVLLARESAVGVIFRRGPSKEVQLIKWNLADDSFDLGQWFKGRIYERRCDLSPDGSFLIYFAATWKEPLRSWTAISKPPYFTALALWPKGDGWNGGGYFLDSKRIHLDHFDGEASAHPDFLSGCRLFKPASFAVVRGEDTPVWHSTLARGGWAQTDEGSWNEYGAEEGFSWKAITPEIWQKPHPKCSWHLEMAIEAINQENGPWYLTKYRVTGMAMESAHEVGYADWADWDDGGDLLFAQNGCLFRQPFGRDRFGAKVLLIDLAGSKFKQVAPPDWATSI